VRDGETIAKVSKVEAANGNLTITLDKVPTKDPKLTDFTATQKIDSEETKSLELSNFTYDKSAKTVKFNFAKVERKDGEQSVEIAVKYNGVTTKAPAFKVGSAVKIVACKADLDAALKDTEIKTIKFSGAYTGDITVTRLVNIDLNGVTIDGNVNIISDEAGEITISAGTITGSLTANTKNAAVNNSATVSRLTTITDVKSGTFNNSGNLNGGVVITDPNGCSFNNTGKIVGTVEISPVNAASAIVLMGSINNPINVTTVGAKVKVDTGAKISEINVEVEAEIANEGTIDKITIGKNANGTSISGSDAIGNIINNADSIVQDGKTVYTVLRLSSKLKDALQIRTYSDIDNVWGKASIINPNPIAGTDMPTKVEITLPTGEHQLGFADNVTTKLKDQTIDMLLDNVKPEDANTALKNANENAGDTKSKDPLVNLAVYYAKQKTDPYQAYLLKTLGLTFNDGTFTACAEKDKKPIAIMEVKANKISIIDAAIGDAQKESEDPTIPAVVIPDGINGSIKVNFTLENDQKSTIELVFKIAE